MANYYKLFLNELKYGAHITALIGPSLLLVMTTVLNLELNYFALLLSYVIPLIVYSFNYQSELHRDIHTNAEKVEYLKKREKIFRYLIVAYVAIAIVLLLLLNNVPLLLLILLIILGGIAYTLFFKVLTGKIVGFKNFYATTLWACYGTFFIVILDSVPLSWLIIFMFAFMYLKLFANAIFFDIKDIVSDKKFSLLTIPIVAGVGDTLRIINLINLLSLIVLITGIYLGFLPLYTIALAVFFLYTYYYANVGAVKDKKRLLKNTYIMADGEFLLWPIVLILSKAIFFSAGITG